MKLQEAKMEFVQTWGGLGSAWGIPRSMAQIHALLLASPAELSTEEVMSGIQLSRGNVNINMRELVNWGLVAKQNKLGERKEFFAANHDIWKMAKDIVKERKKRELLPIQELLAKLNGSTISGRAVDVMHFKKLIQDLEEFINQMDQLSELMSKLNDNVFFKKMVKMLG